MSMQVKAGYVNPLTMMKENKMNVEGGAEGKQNKNPDSMVKELQTKQQQLQNEMLLLKSTGSDTGGMSAEKLEKMEERISQVSEELRAAKTKSDFDMYERDGKGPLSAGIYQRRHKEGMK